MNFLAHVQLSHGIAPVITGNLVADAYKGSKHQVLMKEIQLGVLLHRKIDHLTDTFEDVLKMKKVLSTYYGRYSGVVLDVYFDHFLSIHWLAFNKSTLKEDIDTTHSLLEQNLHLVNDDSKQFLGRLIEYSWLRSYHDKADLEKIFNQMAKRFKIESLKNSMLGLENHYLPIEATFLRLYPFLVSESKSYLNVVGL